MIGTFKIEGNKKSGYRIKDTDTFNNWGTRTCDDDGVIFKTREAAEDYAMRCHRFKTGRSMTV